MVEMTWEKISRFDQGVSRKMVFFVFLGSDAERVGRYQEVVWYLYPYSV